MKHILITTIAAVVLLGCGNSEPDISILDAAYEGNIEVIKQHLAAGSDVNEKDRFQRAPLHYAADYGHREIIELLIAKGAKVNMSNKYGVTPLHWAAGFGKSAAVMMLLDAKANVKAKDENGRTPFAWAKLMGNLEGSKGYWALNRAQYK